MCERVTLTIGPSDLRKTIRLMGEVNRVIEIHGKRPIK